MQKRYDTNVTEIESLAKSLVPQLKGREIFALIGDLGSGKTTFAKALGKVLGVKSKITSPTFILLQEFSTNLTTPQGKKQVKLMHIDAYMTKTVREIKLLGIEELWGRTGVITLIEWADKIKSILPKETIYIYFHALKAKK